jgi:phosphatidylglycerophosphatase A
VRTRTLLLTAFGLGFLRPASGTWGSVLPVAIIGALVVMLGLDGLSTVDRWIVNLLLLVLLVAFTFACAVWGDWAEAHWRWKDPGQVVADEVAGQAIALLLLPWQPMASARDLMTNILIAATAFLAFRFFDIVKPPPAGALQRVPGGWGIVLDDLAAGVYALIATQFLARFVWLRLMTV